MANTEITLKANKPVGVPLTFAEMDQNFASFFYSASVQSVDEVNKLRLHYTGSSLITGDFDTDRYIDVLLPDAQGEVGGAEVGGSNTQIQFNDGGKLLGDPEFVFDKTNNKVSIGNGSNGDSTLDVRGTVSNTATVLKLRARDSKNAESQSFINITKVNQSKLQIGLLDSQSDIPRIKGTSDLEIGINNNRHLKLGTSGTTIGVGASLTPPNKTLTVIGQMGIGNGALTSTQSTFLTLADGSFTGNLTNYLPTNAGTAGLLITTPYSSTTGGNIVVGINKATGANETFSVFSGAQNTFDKTVATFKADGNIGFNQPNPVEVLHVEGNITGSGNIQVEGTATVKTISELASLTTDWESSNTEYARTLVKSSTGLVQYMDAAPIPKGGIIMWAGAVDNVPKGWRLCDGTDENGVAVPDLRERFIVGAGGANTTNPVGGDPSAGYDVGDVGGVRTHHHGDGGELTSDNIPVTYTIPKDGYTMKPNPGNSPENLQISGYNVITDNEPETGEYLESIAYQNKDRTLTSADHSHTIEVPYSNHLPPYYALAFIIYVGVE